ncbi:MAG TPA: RNA polymerase sigma factor [Kofleriaceae bacterium]|nr:RNA polymerase sigma factor [Kofleriaceae bacterium]
MRDREDKELVARLQQGDEAAFEVLFDRHHDALRRTARGLVSTSASAEEVVQDTWVAVLGGLRSFEGRSSIRTWIFRILINRARTRSAREARIVPASAIARAGDGAEPAAEAERCDPDTPNQLLLRKELAGELEAAMLDLPERQRAVVVLRDALGWSPEDVCSALRLNETNQRVLLHRARSRLRVSLHHHRAGGPRAD